MKILVIDDDDHARRMVPKLLQLGSYDVEAARLRRVTLDFGSLRSATDCRQRYFHA